MTVGMARRNASTELELPPVAIVTHFPLQVNAQMQALQAVRNDNTNGVSPCALRLRSAITEG